MWSVLLKAISFAFIILIGIFLRKKNWVGPEAGLVAQKLMLWITLPAAAIVNFASLDKMSVSMAILPLLAVIITFSTVLITLFVTRKKSKVDRISYANVITGVNIGNFCLPLISV